YYENSSTIRLFPVVRTGPVRRFVFQQRRGGKGSRHNRAGPESQRWRYQPQAQSRVARHIAVATENKSNGKNVLRFPSVPRCNLFQPGKQIDREIDTIALHQLDALIEAFAE